MRDSGVVQQQQFVGPAWMASMHGMPVGDHGQRMGDEFWKSVPGVRVDSVWRELGCVVCQAGTMLLCAQAWGQRRLQPQLRRAHCAAAAESRTPGRAAGRVCALPVPAPPSWGSGIHLGTRNRRRPALPLPLRLHRALYPAGH